jgi:hypothetical protein
MKLIPLLSLLVLLGVAAPARAAGAEVGVGDDRVLLAGGAKADRAVAEWAADGVDVVRVFAQSSQIEHADGYHWGPVDQAVQRVRAAGMGVMITITGRPVRPDPARFARFAAAVASRYGAYTDRYIVWNEPNLPSWLQPQASCTTRGCTPVAPHLYRALVRAARPAIRAADPGAQVLIGAMSSRGQDLRSRNSTLRPLVFLRALGCVDRSFHRLKTGRCKHFKPATGDGFAFHPHGTLTSPDRAYPNHDDVNLASLGRLEQTLDRLQRGGRLQASTTRFGLYLDEYGYQTRPPDKTAGVSLATQDRWLQIAAYRAWRDPRVRLLTQYQWFDEPLRRAGSPFAGWQSGLRFVGGKPKPALAHFDTPMVLDAARSRLWGQARPGGAQTVRVERRLQGAKKYAAYATLSTDGGGYWTLKRRLARGARYRFRTALATSASVRR